MDTIRDFAEAAWLDDPSIQRPADRRKPEGAAGSGPDGAGGSGADASGAIAGGAVPSDAASPPNPLSPETPTPEPPAPPPPETPTLDTQPRETMWNRPDPRLGSLELRKLTTRASLPSKAFPGGVQTDFVELYWADLTEGATMRGVLAWFTMLLWRKPKDAPSQVRALYYLLWALLVATAAGVAASLLHYYGWIHLPEPLAKIVGYASGFIVIAGGALVLAGRMFKHILLANIGRVARYTQAKPENIGARAATRERGLAILRALHADPSVDRIILVGHSLGAFLAYDLISYFWAEQEAVRALDPGGDEEKFLSFLALEEAIRLLEAVPDEAGEAVRGPLRADFRKAQARLRRALARGPSPPRASAADGGSSDGGASGGPTSNGGETVAKPGERWLISDFLTLGSPLTHSDFLLAENRGDLMARQKARELPACPPVPDEMDKQDRRAAAALGLKPSSLAYRHDRRGGTGGGTGGAGGTGSTGGWRLHHATPFAAVRWTNIYDPPRALVVGGDFVGGPVGRKRENGKMLAFFGDGVLDINLKAVDSAHPEAGGSWSLITHSSYWKKGTSPARLATFRKALDLLDRDGE